MAGKKNFDPEFPPTKPADWIGAVKVVPEAPGLKLLAGGTTFHVFRSSTDPTWFVVADRAEAVGLPPCPIGGHWVYFQSFREMGRPRIGFSEAEAKAEIATKGYHMRKIGAVVAPAE